MRLFWITAALLALSTPSSAIFATLIGISPTLAKIAMFGLGALGPTFVTTGLVYFLGRHFGGHEIRPKFREPVKPGDRLDLAPASGGDDVSSYSYYSPEESQYAPQNGQAYVEGRSLERFNHESALQEERRRRQEGPPGSQFANPRGRRVVSRA